jgi:hypothetical protein
MLRILLPLVLACGVTVTWADFVQEHRIEGPGVSGVSSMKLKGQKLRMEKPAIKGKETALIDGESGTLVMLIHKDKVALISTIEEILIRPKRLVLEERKKSPKLPKAEPIGHEKIGDWNCAIYSSTRQGITTKSWATNDIPNQARFLKQMKTLMENVPDFDLNALDIPDHCVVKRVITGPDGVTTETLVKFSEEPVSGSEFEVPAGYRKIPFSPKPRTPPPPPSPPGFP